MDPLHRPLNAGLDMIERALDRLDARARGPVPAKPDCVCAECNALFPTPALGTCPKCASNQVRRANPRETLSEEAVDLLGDMVDELRDIADSLEDRGMEVKAEQLRAIAGRAVAMVAKHEHANRRA